MSDSTNTPSEKTEIPPPPAEDGPAKPETQKVLFVMHPDELSLKGQNRGHFEDQLTHNIYQMLSNAEVKNGKVSKLAQRHLLTVPIEYETIVGDQILPRIFGISNYSRAFKIDRDYELLKTSVFEHMKKRLEDGPINYFRVDCSRVDKRYPKKSPEVASEIGAVIHEGLGIAVNFDKTEVTVHIEILNESFIFFSERRNGAHGLPVNTSGKIVSLLSGGFDSPVAAWMMMRRGCQVMYVHFHAAPFGGWRSSVSKIRKLVAKLHEWGGPSCFYAVAIGELQRQIAQKAPAKLRITLYRRLMVRIAKELAQKNKCEALATGDSLGQVASQTIDSMTTIQAAIAPTLVMRPLLGFTKEEIMQKARDIDTFNISILEGGDCCSHLLPKKVATHPSIDEAVEGEKTLDIDQMVSTALSAVQKIDIKDKWNEDEDDEPAVCPMTFEE